MAAERVSVTKMERIEVVNDFAQCHAVEEFFPIGMEGGVDPGCFDPVDLRSPLDAGDPINLPASRGSRQLEAESIYEIRSWRD